MNSIKSWLISIFLITVLNVILNKHSKYLNKEIKWQHYLFGYLFILYIMISLTEVVGFPSLHEWQRLLRLHESIFNPHINLIPFKDGIEISDILNIILFIPLGVCLPTLWERYRSFKVTLWYGLLVSLIIEISQLFVLRRETDIGDLIMNVIGTICGWMIFNVIRKVFYNISNKTLIKYSSKDTIVLRLEPYLYIVIAIFCSFFR